jgi:two-component system phosphate regulon response regulator PhoB
LEQVLASAGYQVLSAATGGEGLDLVRREKPSLVILDLHLPDIPGEEVCRQIRQDPAREHTPVLIFTGKDEKGLSARCLNEGADAYLTKPFDIEDILANVKALLRRTNIGGPCDEVISTGRITVRLGERVVLWKGRTARTLSPKEFRLLCCLVAQTPRVLDKNTLATKVWGTPLHHLHERTLDVHIRRIRKKLGPAAAACLKTIPSIGFQWLDEPVADAIRASSPNN